MTKQELEKQNAELLQALIDLGQWAVGNRGNKIGMPYQFKEVKQAVDLIAKIRNKSSWQEWNNELS